MSGMKDSDMLDNQAKTSMVMPCYNKENSISVMLDTVLAQTWDNIELILVNDGSTDKTREMIAAYEPKFIDRGFEVQIIDQENAGVCAAAKAGLLKVSGDYICMVDSDDELDPNYVAILAGWLQQNPDYDIAICGAANFKDTADGRDLWNLPSKNLPSVDYRFEAENFLFHEIIRSTVWIYMVRAEYMQKCQIVDSYHTDTRGSHEPGYIIPLLSYGGKKKYFPDVLYNFNCNGDGHSQFRDMKHAQEFYNEYDRLCTFAIRSLPKDIASLERKRYLERASLLSRDIHLYRVAVQLKSSDSVIETYAAKLVDTVNRTFGVMPALKREDVLGKEIHLYRAVEDLIFDKTDSPSVKMFPQLSKAALVEEN